MVDVLEFLKRGRRLLDANYSPRKVVLVALVMVVLLLYLGPYIIRLFLSPPQDSLLAEVAAESVAVRVEAFRDALSDLNAHVLYTTPITTTRRTSPPPPPPPPPPASQHDTEGIAAQHAERFVPYVGNGYIGVGVCNVAAADSTDAVTDGGGSTGSVSGSQLFIRQGRSISQAVPYEAVLTVHVDGGILHEAVVTHYTTATVHRLQAWQLRSLADNHRSSGAAHPQPPFGSAHHTGAGTLEVSHRVYAHRTLPSLLVQQLVLINPNDESVFVRLRRGGEQYWQHATAETLPLKSGLHSVDEDQGAGNSGAAGDGAGARAAVGADEKNLIVVTGSVAVPVQLTHRHHQASSTVVVVAVATLPLPPLVEVPPRQSVSVQVLTAVNYSQPVAQHLTALHVATTRDAAVKSLQSALSAGSSALQSAHTLTWRALWRSGLTMATSRADGAINGRLINATLYSVLSQVRVPLAEAATAEVRWQELARLLTPAASEGCYQGHHTLQAERLWSGLSSVEEVNRVVAAWLVTLEKQGCHEVIQAGADGVLQALLLSLGSFCFRNQHLEFNTQAKDLHRDYTFRRLRYGFGVYLNISVEVQDHDYKPVLYLSVDQHLPRTEQNPNNNNNLNHNNNLNDLQNINAYLESKPTGATVMFINPNYYKINSYVMKDVRSEESENTSSRGQRFYACDAGCLDPPVKLSSERQQFPVKLTEPLTAVLYITSDRQHIEELKHTIHVREVAIAPGHHQSVIALHRHGHKWGQLPALFWLSIAGLIIVFHLFLFKLVINEYCAADVRARYRKLSDM